ncbi:MAG: ATP-binding cassette domain-containing protein [Chloroflexi bacterium]|nr:ATP-binding cassette domain-containing protein [Chloroflexota bacterium]
MIAVETRDLCRVYKGRDKRPDVRALDNLSMQIEEGEVHGLLGPNGAGKTTLVKVLSTVLLPTSGSASILGHDVVAETAAVRPLIGIVFGGDRGLYWGLTGRQNLEYRAALYRVPAEAARRRAAELIDRAGLADRADDRVESYSRGMKQRLHLARGLVADARVLFLDEPTTGMDPLAARDFRQLVGELRAEGRTILLTTHDMAEAEAVCDRVALIDHGQLLAVETPRTLGTLLAQHERIDFEGDRAIADQLAELPGVASVTAHPNTSYRVELADASAARVVLAFLVEAGVTSIRTSRPNLEEVYVHVIGDRGLKI